MNIGANVEKGIFTSSDFSSLHAGRPISQPGVTECAPHSGNGCAGSLYSYIPSVIARRDGQGLKVEIWRPRNFGQSCLQANSDLECIKYSPVMGWEALQLANWYFERCEQKEILP